MNRTSIDLLEKWSDKKKGLQTDKQTKFGRSRAQPEPGFGHLNVRYPSHTLSKAVPKMSSRFLLRSQLMGTSGSFGRWHSPQVAPAAQKGSLLKKFRPADPCNIRAMKSIGDRVPKHLRHYQKWIPHDKIRRSCGAVVLLTRNRRRARPF